jgi:hypothetical protein
VAILIGKRDENLEDGWRQRRHMAQTISERVISVNVRDPSTETVVGGRVRVRLLDG